MKNNYVTTANVKAFTAAVGRVHTLNRKGNRIAMIYSDPGLGKTEAAVQYQTNNAHVVYLRAKALTSPRWFLEDLVRDLGEQPMYRSSALFGQAQYQLEKFPRLVIVDEADYLLHDTRCIETLRDLHDTTAASFCILGMEAMMGKLQRFRHLIARFKETVKFNPLTLADIKLLADANCEVKLSDDAAEYIHNAFPNCRDALECMAKAEITARANSLKEITAAHISKRGRK